jgi:hypothetical protein
MADTILAPRPSLKPNAVRALAIVAVVLVAMTVLTVVLGVVQAGPSLDLVPDPVGAMPF